MHTHVSKVSALFSLVVLCAGCGGGGSTEGQVPVYTVSGTVSMAGSPLANATVTFSPKGNQPAALGKTNANGSFVLTTYSAGDGAAEGEYVVMIYKSSETPAAPAADTMHGDNFQAPSHGGGGAAGGGSASTSLVPDRYTRADTTPLQATVTTNPSENVFTFSVDP